MQKTRGKEAAWPYSNCSLCTNKNYGKEGGCLGAGEMGKPKKEIFKWPFQS